MCMCVFVCVCVCVYVCPPLRLLITSDVMWCDIDSRRLVKQVIQLLWQLQSLSLMGVALELIHVIDTNPL